MIWSWPENKLFVHIPLQNRVCFWSAASSQWTDGAWELQYKASTFFGQLHTNLGSGQAVLHVVVFVISKSTSILALFGPFRTDSNQSSELDSSSSRFYKRVKDYATVSSPQKVINSNSWIQNELVSNRNEHKKIHCSKHFRNTIYGIWNQALNSYLTYKNANEFKIITIKSSIISSITIIPTGTNDN